MALPPATAALALLQRLGLSQCQRWRHALLRMCRIIKFPHCCSPLYVIFRPASAKQQLT